MRALNAEFELFGTAHVPAGEWVAGDVAETEIARLGETRRTAREYKNSGNEAKEYLKTKDITFLKAVNDARFAHKLTAIWRKKEHKTPRCAKNEVRLSGPKVSVAEGTNSRLGGRWAGSMPT
jgi:hypothetical protein